MALRGRSYRLLDLFCGEGGAGAGYAAAGFEVVGVDVVDQPRYPFEFIQGDALALLDEGLAEEFDAVHASPPCQAWSAMRHLVRHVAPELIAPTRERLRSTSRPWVMENVMGAPLLYPTMLCGEMFGLRLHRHRLFESSFLIPQPTHPMHRWASMDAYRSGRPADHEAVCPVGAFGGADIARVAMEMPWGSQKGLSQAIPAAFTRYVGGVLVDHIEGRAAEQLAIAV